MNERSEQMTNQPGTTNDLTVAAQQADASKGGPRLIIKKAPTFADEAAAALPDLAPNGDVKGGLSVTERERPVGGGMFINNHNELMVSDEADDSDAMMATLLDLPLACDGAEVKGGKGHGTGGTENGGFWINNHNETIATDEDETPVTTEPLADLPVNGERAEQTKGGALLLPAVQVAREAARRA